MIVENVSAVLKDIKVTKKGINLTLEDVRLKGEQLQDLASLIGEVVLVGVDIPQMNLFEDEDVNKLEAPQEVEEEAVTDEDVSDVQFEAVEETQEQEGTTRLFLSEEEVAQELGV